MKKKKTIKREQLSNLRQPTEEEKQQIKVCLEEYFNHMIKFSNRLCFIFMVLGFFLLSEGGIILFAVAWVGWRDRMNYFLEQQLLEYGSYQIAEGKVTKRSMSQSSGKILVSFENANGEKAGTHDVINKYVEVGTPLKLAVFDLGDDKRKYYYMFTSYMLSVGKYQP